tara:strand:- start:550 stop:1437 length:888 start_codon:yes stop_codon:yes gene_type:complete
LKSLRIPDQQWDSRIGKRKISGVIFFWGSAISTCLGIIVLALLLFDVLTDGLQEIDIHFITSFPSRFPEKSGLRSALFGSLWLLVLTAFISFPLGVASAIYLEEYAPESKLKRFIQLNIANLAGVPSVVYGLLGLGIFVRTLGLGRSILAGSMTMSLLILPIIIVAAREALRAVPDSLREGALALGASKWQMVRRTVLPAAMPGILTGTILALSRAVGETAPLITIGALTYIAFDPSGPMDLFTVLPIQIFNWVSLPQKGFHSLAAGGIVVLLVVLFAANLTAVIMRYRFERKMD